MHKLVSESVTPEHVKKFGNYNQAPKGWTEISVDELVTRTHFHSYIPDLIEHRQIIVRRDRPMLDACLYFYWDGTGIGIVTEMKDDPAKKPFGRTGVIRYFRFGCVHEYRELGGDECRKRGIQHFGRCWHVSECTKCGHVHSVDTSD